MPFLLLWWWRYFIWRTWVYVRVVLHVFWCFDKCSRKFKLLHPINPWLKLRLIFWIRDVFVVSFPKWWQVTFYWLFDTVLWELCPWFVEVMCMEEVLEIVDFIETVFATSDLRCEGFLEKLVVWLNDVDHVELSFY